MDPATLGAAAYGLETAVEAGVAGYFLTQPTLPLKARLSHASSVLPLPRSAHSLSVIGTRAYIFGGRSQDGKPATNDIHELELPTPDTENTAAIINTITAIGETGDVPQARLHHTAAVARQRIFVFGGQNPKTEKVIEENGRLWVFDPLDSKWLFLDPPPKTAFPSARYKHSMTASDTGDAIFIHSGLETPESKLNDTWAFYLDHGKWTRLSDSPSSSRSGASITVAKDKLWKLSGGGLDPRGELSYFQLPPTQSLDAAGTLNLEKREWNIAIPEASKSDEAPTIPSARSGAALHYLTTGNGRDYILLALGERESPSAGESPLMQDIWAYQLPSSGLSGANLKDAIKKGVPGASAHEGEWAEVEITRIEVAKNEKSGGSWTGRRWFGSCVTGKKQFMLWGGRNVGDEDLGDGWIVKIE